MNIIRKLLAAAAVLAVVLSAAAIGEGAASASTSPSTSPVVYAANNDGWHGYVKPGHFYFGNGGSPIINSLRWKPWGSGSAWATGKLWIIKSNCYPLYKCPYYSRWAGVYLSTVRTHNGVRYYARMAVEFFVAGKARWDVGWFGANPYGGTLPVWRFPEVWPYL